MTILTYPSETGVTPPYTVSPEPFVSELDT